MKKAKEKEKAVAKAIEERIEVTKYKARTLNARAEEAIDKVKNNQRSYEANGRKRY